MIASGNHPLIHVTVRRTVTGRKKPRLFSRGFLCLRYLFSRLGQLSSCRSKCPVDTCRQKKAPTFRSRLSCLRYLLSQLGQLSSCRRKCPVGSDARGRCSEQSEWQRSTDGKALCRRSQMSGTATGNLSSWRRKCPVDTSSQNKKRNRILSDAVFRVCVTYFRS